MFSEWETPNLKPGSPTQARTLKLTSLRKSASLEANPVFSSKVSYGILPTLSELRNTSVEASGIKIISYRW